MRNALTLALDFYSPLKESESAARRVGWESDALHELRLRALLDGIGPLVDPFTDPSVNIYGYDGYLSMSNEEIELVLKGEARKEIIRKFHINLNLEKFIP